MKITVKFDVHNQFNKSLGKNICTDVIMKVLKENNIEGKIINALYHEEFKLR